MSDLKKELNSSKVFELSESDDGLYMYLTGQLCYMDDYNLNGIKLLKGKKFEENLNSLVGTPVVAKYVWDEENGSDFRGHEAYRDWFTGNILFDTDAVGVHESVWVENKKVKPVFSQEETELPVIMYKAKIWSDRFPNFAKVIRKLYSQDNLGTSWELIPNSLNQEESNMEAVPNPRSTDDLTFVGNCLLGKDVIGAYEGTSKVTNVSTSGSIQSELSQALMIDIKNASQNQSTESEKGERGTDMEERITKLESELAEAKAKLEEYENANKDSEIASLTEKVKTLEIEKSELEEKLVKATESLATVNSEVAELKEVKEKYDAIQAEKAEEEKQVKIAELTDMVTKGDYVTKEEIETSEELKKMIEDCDEGALKVFRAERILAKLDAEDGKKETSEVKKEKSIQKNFSEENKVETDVMKEFLSK